MKKSIVLMLCCLFYISLQVGWAQDYKIVWGNADSRTEKLTPIKILGKDKTGIYVFAKLGSLNQLVKYDLNMNYLWNTSLELRNSKNKVLDYIGLTLTANKIILFASDYDKVTKIKKICAAYISQSGIVDQKYKDIYTFQKEHSENQLEVVFIEQESLILISSSKFRMLANDVTSVYSDQFIYLNENLIVQKDVKDIEPILENGIFHASEYGTDYFLGVYSIIKDSKNHEDLGEEFYLMRVGEKTKEKKEYKLDLGKYTIANVNLLSDTLAERYVVVCGYYFDKDGEVFLGTYSIKIDLVNKSTGSAVLKPFGSAFIDLVGNITNADGNQSSEQKQKVKATLKDYEIRGMFLNEKGDLMVINEQYATSFTSVSTGQGHAGSTTQYYFKDVLITSFDSTGNRKWSTIIPKYQKTAQYDRGSIGLFPYKDELYVIYTDNAANGTSLSTDRYVTTNLNTAALVCVKVYGNGQMKKSIIMPAKELLIKPMWMELVGNEVILIGFQDGNYKIGKVILE